MGSYFEQARKLCADMTLREKLGQITQTVDGYHCYEKTADGIELNDTFRRVVSAYGGIGALSGLLRADPWTRRGYGNGIEPAERELCAKTVQDYLRRNTRLGIPALIELETAHGLQALGSVMYPTGLCSAASFDPELYGQMMHAIGTELKLSENHVAFVTMIDLARDPRWGRSEECLGENPRLAAQLAASAVRELRRAGVLVCAKHFFAGGAPMGGHNQMEVTAGERELREIHLVPARAAVEAGAEFVMVAYNTVDGVPCHANAHLLRRILRDELGFDGVALSDGAGVAMLCDQLGVSAEQAAVMALNAGVDMSLCDEGPFLRLEDAAAKGSVLLSRIDEACVRVLEKKYEAGLMEEHAWVPGAALEYIESGVGQALAYRMAAESAVLLKNDGMLPLRPDARVCMVGENLDDIYCLLGDYTSPRKDGEGQSVRRALEARFPGASFARGWSFSGKPTGDDLAALAARSDVVVLGMGGSSVRDFETAFESTGAAAGSTYFMDCGEGCDVSELTLPADQLDILRALKKTGKPVAVVLICGRAYDLREVSELADAILVAWYPGQEGGRAVADILAGDVCPSGKLPVTFPRSAGCLPVCPDCFGRARTYTDGSDGVLYPFGFGLSYAQTRVVSATARMTGTGTAEAELVLENLSDIPCVETAQVYLHITADTRMHRRRELAAFRRVSLPAHEAVRVRLTFDLAPYEIQSDSAQVEVYAGTCSDCPCCAALTPGKG